MDTFLISHIQKHYKNPDKTKRDINNVILHYRGLIAKLDTFVFNDGSSKQLVCLDGTVPVPYKGNTYNIPICVWILDTHPNHAPMVYVRPTTDMRLKVSQYVDQNGKVYSPYLHAWSPVESDLVGLVQILIIAFGEQPPVYSVAASRPPENVAPYPVSGGGYPPYPTQNTPYPVSYPVPYPAGGNPASTGYPPYPSTGYPSYPMAGSAATNPTTNYLPYPMGSNPGTGTITEDHIRASLLSAVEDKVRRRLGEEYMKGQAELETLKKTANELTQGQRKLEEMSKKLNAEQVEVERCIAALRERSTELEDSLSKLKIQDANFDVDEAVVTTAPLYKQLLNAYAEEAATEDTIYYLGEGLRRGVIELDVFLKHVRSLSRKQFMLRALMERCRQQAGLPT